MSPTSIEEHQGSFRSHQQYIAALAMLCRAPYTKGKVALFSKWDRDSGNLKEAVCQSPTMAVPAKVCPRLDVAEASLRNAWGTELLLALGGEIAFEDELVRLTNNWAVVQAYYCCYHAMQALVAARGNPRPESHPKTQKLFADFWANRSVDLPPWSFGARDGGWQNARSTPDDGIHPWTTCTPANCWDLAGKALRTTREDALRSATANARDRKKVGRRKEWNAEEQSRLSKGRKPRKLPAFPLPLLTVEEKAAVGRRVPTKTVIDYLYRLRVKTNYEDAAMFTDGPTDDTVSTLVNGDLRFLAASTLLVHELHIRELVGPDTLLGWADTWLAKGPARGEHGLAARRALLEP